MFRVQYADTVTTCFHKTSFIGSRITATIPKAKEKFRMVAILLITLYKSVIIIKAACFLASVTIHFELERTGH